MGKNPMLDGENQNPSCVLLLTLMSFIILWRAWKATFSIPPMVGNGLLLTMAFNKHSCPLWETQGFMFNVNKLMSFHYFPFKFFCQQVDIVLSTNIPHTLDDVVIVNPTQINLVSCVVLFRKVVAIMAV